MQLPRHDLTCTVRGPRKRALLVCTRACSAAQTVHVASCSTECGSSSGVTSVQGPDPLVEDEEEAVLDCIAQLISDVELAHDQYLLELEFEEVAIGAEDALFDAAVARPTGV